MSNTETSNYGLIKPSETDYYDISVFNNNSDVIDTELKDHEDRIKLVEENVHTSTADTDMLMERILVNSKGLLESNIVRSMPPTTWGAVDVFMDNEDIAESSTATYDIQNKNVKFSSVDQQLDLKQDMTDPFKELDVSVYPKEMRKVAVKEDVTGVDELQVTCRDYELLSGDKVLVESSERTINSVQGGQTKYDFDIIPKNLQNEGWVLAGRHCVVEHGGKTAMLLHQGGNGYKIIEVENNTWREVYHNPASSFGYGGSLVYYEPQNLYIFCATNRTSTIWIYSIDVDTGVQRGTVTPHSGMTSVTDTKIVVWGQAWYVMFLGTSGITYTIASNLQWRAGNILDTGIINHTNGGFATDVNAGGTGISHFDFEISQDVGMMHMVYNYFGADGSNWFKYARKSSELTSGTEMEATWTGITLRYNNTSQSHINQIALKEQCSGEGRGRVFIACDMDHVAHMWWTDTPEINSPTVWQRHQLNKASGKREFCKGVKLYEDAQGKVYCGFMNQNGEIVEYPFKSYKIDGDSMTHCKLPEFSWNNELDCTANPITLGDPWTANQAGSNLSLVNDNGVMKIAARDSSSTLGFYKESNNIAKEDTVVMEARLKVVSGSKLPCYLSISDGELAVIARMDVDGGFHLGNVFTPVVDGYDFSSDFAKIRIVKFGQLGGAIWVNDKLALAGFDIFIKSSTNRVSFGVGSGSDTNDEVHFDNVKYATGIKKDYKKVRKPAVQLLYDRGTQNVTWEAGYSEGNSSQSIESNCLKLEVHGNGASTASCTYVTSEQVDVTDVDHILITVTGYDTNHQWGKINAGLLTNKSHSLTASGVQLGVVAQGLESAKVHAVDVRNFSGLYYIGLEARDSSISVNYNGCYEVQSVSLVGVGYYEPVSSLPRYAKGKGFYGYGIENVEWEYREVRGNGGHIHAKATDHLRLALEGGVQEKEIYWTTSDPIDTSKYGWIFAVVEGSRFEEMTGSGCLVMMTTASKDVGWNNSIARIDAEYHRGSTMNGKHVVALDLRQESGLQYLSVGLVDNGSSTANVSDVKISFIGQPEAVDNGWDLMPWVMAGDRQVYQHSKQTIGQGYNITLDQPVTLEKGTQLPITTQLVPSVNGVQGVLQSVDDERLNFKSTVTESTTVDISITGKCVELDAVMYHI